MTKIIGKVNNKQLIWEDGKLSGDSGLIYQAENIVSSGGIFNPHGIKAVRASISDVDDLKSITATFLLLGNDVEIIESPKDVTNFIDSLDINEDGYLVVY